MQLGQWQVCWLKRSRYISCRSSSGGSCPDSRVGGPPPPLSSSHFLNAATSLHRSQQICIGLLLVGSFKIETSVWPAKLRRACGQLKQNRCRAIFTGGQTMPHNSQMAFCAQQFHQLLPPRRGQPKSSEAVWGHKKSQHVWQMPSFLGLTAW